MPTQATIRRDPRNTGKGLSKRNGFTVIELMIAIAVFAIITSLALPSYQFIMEKRQITSAAEQIGAFLSSAQIEAIKREEALAVRYMRTDSDTWCLGIVPVAAGSTSNTPCDCTRALDEADACKTDGQLRVFSDLNLDHPNLLSAVSGDGAFVFDPARGFLVEPGDEPLLQLLSEEGTYALNVGVTATGRVTVCSNGANKAVPGVPTC